MAIDKTAKQESAQALFCALADYLGAGKVDDVFDLDKFPTYLSFKKYWDENYPQAKIDTTFKTHVDADANLNSVEQILTGVDVAKTKEKDDWYKSSVLIAKTLIKDIHKNRIIIFFISYKLITANTNMPACNFNYKTFYIFNIS
jgi:hypothetical protein